MSGISDLYNATRSRSMEIECEFEDLENDPKPTFERFTKFETALTIHFKSIEELFDSIKNERPDSRALWTKRIQPIKDDYFQLKTNFTKLQSRKMAQLKREQLMEGKTADVEIAMDAALLKENEALKRTVSLADQYIETSRAILSDLHDQGGILKGARTKLLSLSNKLGISGGILTKAGRRSKEDKYIILIGMFLVILLIWFLYRWTHKSS
ncbi:hypothetical protein WA158_006826 [Blastocystis sp. Blastoise]